jgi:parallel beta-helix repeat protein
MLRTRLSYPFITALLLGGVSFGCSSDDKTPGTGGSGGVGGAGGSTSGGAGGSGGAGPSDCTTTVDMAGDPTDALQTALIEASSGDTVCIPPGTYGISREISLASARNLTLRGTGERDEVVLDFADQAAGADGINVTADGFTIENLWVKNTRGNGIVVKADDSVFRNIRVSWDAGSVTENGAYAVYPTNCNRTLIDGIEVSGAADAGVYVGQCTGAIVRNCKAHGNVLGIEIENTTDADVYDNEVWDNTGGILVDLLPNKQKKTSNNALVRNNLIYDNNRPNFAPPGGIIAAVPAGTGIMVLAASDTEIRGNTLRDNDGVAVVVVSYEIIGLLVGQQSTDPETDQWPKRTFVGGNTYESNGTNPTGTYAALLGDSLDSLEDVLWDGYLDPEYLAADGGAGDDASMELCLGTPEQDSFRNFNGPGGLSPDVHRTDPTPHQCTLDPLPELSSF